jgi:hypothetical protein
MTDTTQIKKKAGCLAAFGWLAALVLVGWGVAAGQNQPLAAALLIGAAILALPPVQRRAAAAMKPGTPRWTLAALPIALAAIGIGWDAIPNAADVEEAKDPVASVVRYQARHLGATQSCKEGFQAISDEAQSASPALQRMYDLAAATQRECRAARTALQRIDQPKGLSVSETGQFIEASRTCDLAYLLAEQAADKLKVALDGGMAPSQIAAFREKANEAIGTRQSCDQQIAEAAERAVSAHRDNSPAN